MSWKKGDTVYWWNGGVVSGTVLSAGKVWLSVQVMEPLSWKPRVKVEDATTTECGAIELHAEEYRRAIAHSERQLQRQREHLMLVDRMIAECREPAAEPSND
jgi:hypothetical protein